MKDKDRMAKAINAEFSDEDDEDNDNKSNWDDDEKVKFRCKAHPTFSFKLFIVNSLLTMILIIFL